MNLQKTSRYWALLIACFTLMAVLTSLVWIYTTGRTLDVASVTRILIPEILFWNVWVLTAPLIFWFSSRFSFPVSPFSWKWAIHLPLALLATSINFALYIGLFSIHFAISEALGFQLNASLLAEIQVRIRGIYSIALPLGSIIYVMLVVLSQVQTYYERLRQEKDHNNALQNQLVRARREALQMQLHPHFLYNSLNTISATLQTDTAAADSMLSKLGDFLRNTLEHAERTFVTLSEEIAFSEQYLQIEHHRFEDRLQIEIDVAPAVNEARVPYLILQPIVENAVRHGVAQQLEPGRIVLSARQEEERLVLEVFNSGPPVHQNGNAPATGIGLKNTADRLALYYGDDATFKLENVPSGGVCARINLPLTSQETTDAKANPTATAFQAA